MQKVCRLLNCHVLYSHASFGTKMLYLFCPHANNSYSDGQSTPKEYNSIFITFVGSMAMGTVDAAAILEVVGAFVVVIRLTRVTFVAFVTFGTRVQFAPATSRTKPAAQGTAQPDSFLHGDPAVVTPWKPSHHFSLLTAQPQTQSDPRNFLQLSVVTAPSSGPPGFGAQS
jgi:hypothetical protein